MTELHSTLQELEPKLLENFTQKWTQTMEAHFPFRRSYLRELCYQSHHYQSKNLALGKPKEVHFFRRLEAHLESWKRVEKLPSKIQECFDSISSLEPIQDSVFSNLPFPLEKIKRFDRLWEYSICYDALKASWNFWKVTTCIEASFIELWMKQCTENLEQKGILLFMETQKQSPLSLKQKSTWESEWYFVARSELHQIEVDWNKLPGSVVPNEKTKIEKLERL